MYAALLGCSRAQGTQHNGNRDLPPKRTLKPRTKRLGCLGEAIEQARKKAGLSQAELAIRAEIHSTHIGGLERGSRNPTYETLDQVADGLGITIGQLVARAERICAKK